MYSHQSQSYYTTNKKYYFLRKIMSRSLLVNILKCMCPTVASTASTNRYCEVSKFFSISDLKCCKARGSETYASGLRRSYDKKTNRGSLGGLRRTSSDLERVNDHERTAECAVVSSRRNLTTK